MQQYAHDVVDMYLPLSLNGFINGCTYTLALNVFMNHYGNIAEVVEDKPETRYVLVILLNQSMACVIHI